MPGGKDNKPKPIAEKYSLDYYRRPLVTRSWKTWWNSAALVLAGALFAGIYLFQGNAVFQSAPVSAAHSTFGQNCAACHDASWQTARRLVTFDDSAHSVSDKACRACHQVADHAAGLKKAADCASCHQEHRPERELSVVMDRHCIKCHGQLDLHGGGDAAVSFVAEIDQFELGDGAHPEFALLRASESEVGPRHLARKVATFATQDAGGGEWQDRSGLKFNHHRHLDPQGPTGPDRKKRVLDCGDCHVPEADGRYMQPVSYEQHCQECHPLRLTGKLSALGEVPHGSVDEVYGFLRRAKLTELNVARSQDAAAVARPASPRDAVKTRLPTPGFLSKDEEAELMLEADHVVFGREAKGMCRHCHHVVERNGVWEILDQNPQTAGDEAAALVTTDVPMVPDRWFHHAQFDHKSHRAIACGECHRAAASSTTADILLPSIATCRSCHGSEAVSGRVRADCVLCHTYHDAEHDTGGVPLEKLFTVMQSQAALHATP
ncbi:MAG: hypothetical protein WD971_01110 [Pirellulales bacterium]